MSELQTASHNEPALRVKRPKVKTPEAAAYLGLAVSTLECDRTTRKLGIPFYRIGRAVVYDLDDLDLILAAGKAVNVGEAA